MWGLRCGVWGVGCGVRGVRVDVVAPVVDLVGQHLVSRFAFMGIVYPSGPLGSSITQHRRTPGFFLDKGCAFFRITSGPPIQRIALGIVFGGVVGVDSCLNEAGVEP